MRYSIGIIGIGKVGTTLALLLNKKLDILYLVTRSPEKSKMLSQKLGVRVYPKITPKLPKVDLILITTPDDIIVSIARELTENACIKKGSIVAHTSGSLSSEVIKNIISSSAYTASVHPLKSFTGKNVSEDFLEGAYFAIEGDKRALPSLEKIVSLLKGNSFTIKTEQKVLYHAAASVACNYLVSLNHYAIELLKACGIEGEVSLSLLKPLVEGTIKNIFSNGAPKSLTGPIERGDIETVKEHLRSIEKLGNLEKEIYTVLGLYTCRVANEKNYSFGEKYKKIEKILEELK